MGSEVSAPSSTTIRYKRPSNTYTRPNQPLSYTLNLVEDYDDDDDGEDDGEDENDDVDDDEEEEDEEGVVDNDDVL